MKSQYEGLCKRISGRGAHILGALGNPAKSGLASERVLPGANRDMDVSGIIHSYHMSNHLGHAQQALFPTQVA